MFNISAKFAPSRFPGEELGLIESQEIRENHTTNSSSNDWSSASIERELIAMERERKSTENEAPRSPEERGSDDEGGEENSGFALGLMKSNSVVARASMWQQLQQQAKGKNMTELLIGLMIRSDRTSGHRLSISLVENCQRRPD